ncbi:MAG: PBP1A family penicillin-binding protein [Alphaproteobacteria bacterium]|nr:PBP1A family penicillin-binding protein [Alphaproteobacteria bacterium]
MTKKNPKQNLEKLSKKPIKEKTSKTKQKSAVTKESAAKQGAKSAPKDDAEKSPFKALAWKLSKICLIIGIWFIVIIGSIVFYYSLDMPNVEEVAKRTRTPNVTIVDNNGKIIASHGNLYGEVVEATDVSQHLIDAILATEDRRFYSHFGLDPIGFSRAMLANLKARRFAQGGSTITQQVAKNLFLSREKTIKRKVQELLFAFWLETKFTKNQILTLYINRVYFGQGAYGVEAASNHYFKKSAKNINIYQAALLAGILKAPSTYNPIHNPEKSLKRTRQVLINMVNAGFIDEKNVKLLSTEQFKYITAVESHETKSARYFSDWIIDQTNSLMGSVNNDIVISTTHDSRIQEIAEGVLKAALKKQPEDIQGAIVVMSPNGAVRALVGGKNYSTSQFNRATQALRQPGSAFKPFIYLAAVEKGFTPNDLVEDKPIKIGDWAPKNYNDKYLGLVTIKEALAKSINSVAVYLSEAVGRMRVVSTAKKLGITTELRPTPSIALGTNEVTLIDLTSAYATFCNDGFGIWSYGVNSIVDKSENPIYIRSGTGPGQLIKPSHVAAMNEMLAEVINTGTGKAAALQRVAAGKTGTTQNNRDAWFIGYTSDYIVGVWIGKDNGSPMKNMYGGGLPAKIWHDIMLHIHTEPPSRNLLGITNSNHN